MRKTILLKLILLESVSMNTVSLFVLPLEQPFFSSCRRYTERDSSPKSKKMRNIQRFVMKAQSVKFATTSVVSFAVDRKLQILLSLSFIHILYQTDRSKKVFSLLAPAFLENQYLQGLGAQIMGVF